MKLPNNYVDFKGHVAQLLPIFELPPEITLGSTLYKIKAEPHCTIVAYWKLIPRVMEADWLEQPAAEALVLREVQVVFDLFKPHIGDFLPDFRVVTLPVDGKQTIAIMARGEGFDEFYAELSRRLRIDIPVQPAHATIYSIDVRPIGLNSQLHLRERTRSLTETELAEWNKQVDTKKIFGVEV